MTYYVATPSGQHEGPFTVEELIRRGITPDTLVYNSELNGWTKASMVPEIAKSMYGETPQNAFNNNQSGYTQQPVPGFQQYNTQPGMPYQTPQIAPKTWLAESIIVTLSSFPQLSSTGPACGADRCGLSLGGGLHQEQECKEIPSRS